MTPVVPKRNYSASDDDERLRTYNWGGGTRTCNLLVNSQALCQLSYTPS